MPSDRARKRAYEETYRKNHPERVFSVSAKYRDRKFFNLLPGEWERIWEFQKGHPVFSFLLNKPTYKMREAVEHRHSDGLIRGLMNGMLNRAYGIVERLYPHNTAEVLRALAEFHENPPATQVLGETVYGIIGRAQAKKVFLYGPDGRSTPHERRMDPKV